MTTTTNYKNIAIEMANSLAALSGWTIGEVNEDTDGYWFIATKAPYTEGRGRRAQRMPGFTTKRHINRVNGELSVTKL